jgi:glycosyltransferase involved in cell wall biosynthesis
MIPFEAGPYLPVPPGKDTGSRDRILASSEERLEANIAGAIHQELVRTLGRRKRQRLKVSVIIPTYNRQARVLRAIDCVLAQTSPVDEIIIVDDGSTDGTAEAIHARHGSRIKVLRQGNQGVSAARNNGIREAQGEWIAFLDSDDVWLPTKMESQFEALASFGGEPGVCFTDNFFDGDPNLKLSRFQEMGFGSVTRFGTLNQAGRFILAGREPFFTSSVIVQRSLLESIPLFDEALMIGEDGDLFFRLSFITCFCFVAEPLVCVDRTPTRTVGLCNLYFTRDDRKYDSLERRFAKWLAMPEVAGTEYEEPARARLRELCYDSVECKIHDFRLGAALREVNTLKTLGDSYASVLVNLFSRKMRKLQMAGGAV